MTFMWIFSVIVALFVGFLLGSAFNFDWKAYYDYKLKSEELNKARRQQ